MIDANTRDYIEVKCQMRFYTKLSKAEFTERLATMLHAIENSANCDVVACRDEEEAEELAHYQGIELIKIECRG